MPRGLRNWTYRDVTDFLRDHGFTFFEEREGSHEAWIRRDSNGKEFVVEVDFKQGGKAYPPLTLLTMIGQSGIERREWRRWASS